MHIVVEYFTLDQHPLTEKTKRCVPCGPHDRCSAVAKYKLEFPIAFRKRPEDRTPVPESRSLKT